MLPEITHSLLHTLHNQKSNATFFCLGWIAKKQPGLIREIQAAGHEIAAHSFWHQQVHKQSRKAFSEDLKQNILTLEDITGQKVIAYRAPAFTLFPTEGYGQEELLRLGIRFDSSVLSGMPYHGQILPNQPFRLQEQGLIYFPVSAFKLLQHPIPYAGSGYFRLLPESFIQHKLRTGNYHMLYFHPRDLDHRMHELREFSLIEKLRFNTHTSASLPKLKRLLSQYPMMAIKQACQNKTFNLNDFVQTIHV